MTTVAPLAKTISYKLQLFLDEKIKLSGKTQSSKVTCPQQFESEVGTYTPLRTSDFTRAAECSSGPLTWESMGFHSSRSIGNEGPQNKIHNDDHDTWSLFNAWSQGKQRQELEMVPARFTLARTLLCPWQGTDVLYWERESPISESAGFESQRSS